MITGGSIMRLENTGFGMKARLLALAVLVQFMGIGMAQAQVKIHVKNPWPTMTIWEGMKVTGGVIAGPPGANMTDDGDGWYSYTLDASQPFNSMFSFALYSPATWDATGKTPDYASKRGIYASGAVSGGGTGTEFSAGNIRTYGDDVWIIPSLTGAPIITIVPQAKKVALLFNPWGAGAPTAKVGNGTTYGTMIQSQDPARCGWYGAYFNAGPFTVAYKSLFGSETYGIGGLGDAKAIDLTSLFATSDTVFIYSETPGTPPKLTNTAPPGLKGVCSFLLGVTVRDFSKEHPDFDDAALDHHDLATTGMVANTLDKDGKPTVGAKPFLQSDFSNWFRTKTTGGKDGNVASCYNLPMTKSTKGMWGYNSLKDSPSHSFFPVDDKNTFGETLKSQYYDAASGTYPFDPTKGDHNFNFCMEMHASFKYEKGQVFNFTGDDDTWAFIDGKLALDIGGPHPPVSGKIELDKLGLKEDTDYPFDFFFCERQPNGSDLLVETSIFFEQQQSTFYKKIDLGGGAFRYEIWEITQGKSECGAAKGGDTALTQAVFKLSGPSVNPPEVLSVGTKYGGVTVLPSFDKVTVDTNSITGLRPGLYTISFTTKSGYGTLKFTVPGTEGIEFSDKRPVKEILKTSVPVNIQASLSGTPDKREATFVLKPQTGLLLFADSAQTIPVAAGTPIKTDVNGAYKLYATSSAAGTYKLELFSGTGNTVLFDTFGTLTFIEQPKVAKPLALPPGTTFILPINVTLSTSTTGADVSILYTTDGTPPAAVVGGSTKLYTGPIPLAATTQLQAMAVKPGWINSEILIENYTYTAPLGIRKAYYKDMNGDGRIETVILEFEKDIPFTPDKLEFTIVDAAGKSWSVGAAKAEIAYTAGSKSSVTVSLAKPFEFGVTVVGNRDVSGKIFKQDNIPSLEANFPVDDSVPPVIMTATVRQPDSTQLLERIEITLSENVDFPLTSQTAVVFKKDGAEVPAGTVKIHHIEKTGDRAFVIYIDSLADPLPVVGDFIALNTGGEIKDGPGNAPVVKAWMLLGGSVPAAKPLDLYVTFPNSKKDKAADGLESHGNTLFIPITKEGGALPGDALLGKCQGCYTGDAASFVGPVFHIVTPGPMKYDFKIFSTSGEFVAAGKGEISPEDLKAMDRRVEPSGMKYTVRVVWTGLSDKGGKAGTGAYILQSVLTSAKDPRTGAPEGHQTKRVTFGLLRSFRGS